MELIKLSLGLGLPVLKNLQKKGIKPRETKYGIYSLEFTKEELEMVDEIKIDYPTPGCLNGLEYCKNLEKLEISSFYSEYQKDGLSISDADIKTISKITSLKSLTISNQKLISWVYLDKLINLEELSLTRNANLEEVCGLENLKKIKELEIFGNVELYELQHIDDLVKSNDLDYLALDLLHYPEVSQLMFKLLKITSCYFVEAVTNKKDVTYGPATASIFNGKCLKILDETIKNCRNKKEIIILLEKYLAENVFYDRDALKQDGRYHTRDGKKVGRNYGTNSAFNAIMYNSCVCEGYTRAMQYLLKLLKIKTKNVSCIGGQDRIKYDKHRSNLIMLPDDGYHSIIRIDFPDAIYYCDPCWDSSHWHAGDETLPYCLKNKKDILQDHTLSFEENNVSIDGTTPSVSPEYIEDVLKMHKKQSSNKKK